MTIFLSLLDPRSRYITTQNCITSIQVTGNFVIHKYLSRSKVKVKSHQSLSTSRGHHYTYPYTKLHQFLISSFSVIAPTPHTQIDRTENNTLLRWRAGQNYNIRVKSPSPIAKQGIHRHQSPPRYRNAARGSRFSVVVPPPRFSVAPITAKHDVIHKTGST